MLKRLLIGVIKGLLLGGLAYAGPAFGLHWAFSGAFLAYVLAVVLGAMTGLIAGKPIWSSGAGIEAGLKSFFGMGLGALGLFLVHRFLPLDPLVNMIPQLSSQSPAPGYNLLALPIVSTLIAMLYEIDNTPEQDDGSKAKAASTPKKLSGARIADLDTPIDDLEEPVVSARKTNKR
ncbi:MAG: hypothetical protein U0165_14275 [Polyangiaceae bacterium]